MLILVTGINGAGKTLNTIKYVNEADSFKVSDSDGNLIPRPVFYYNIKSLNLAWKELDEQGVRDWQSLPDGSIVIVDEAYKVFPTRAAGKPVPAYIQALAEHRHRGMDFIFICQRGMGQLDAFLRGLVGRHIHLERQFNTSRVRWIEWQQCQDDTKDFHARKEAMTKVVTLDKKYYSVYKSSELHTMKSNVPWFRIVGISLAVLMVPLLIFLAYKTMGSDRSVAVPSVSPSTTSVSMFDRAEAKPENILEMYVPRIPDFPHTAPIYDDLTKPRSYPRLQCYRWETGPKKGVCKCFTQQATLVQTSLYTCNAILDKGYFDPALPDHALESASAAGKVLAPGARLADVSVTRQ